MVLLLYGWLAGCCSLKLIPPLVERVKSELGLDSHLNTVVGSSHADFSKNLQQCSAAAASTIDPRIIHKDFIGIFQPPGHKGPF